jgi:O-methyltransferase
MSKTVPSPDVLSPSHVALLQMVYGAQTSQVIYVAAKIGIADSLKDGPRNVADMAAISSVDRSTLRRVLRFLVSRGICTESPRDQFALTELGQLLRSDHADSVRHRAIFNAEVLLPLWTELLHTVMSGDSGARRLFGMSLYEHLAKHPEIGALFDRTMAAGARYRHGPAIAAYDFSSFGTIVDVGGGNGKLLISLLQTYPEPRGIVFDLPLAAERARQNIEAAGLADRCIAIGGNAFEGVPEGGNAYMVSNFLIDVDDEGACTILKHCRKVMADDAKLLLVEWVIPTADETSDSYKFWDTASMDLIMLSIGGSRGGRVRTAEEFRALLESAGFVLKRLISTSAAIRVIEATPATGGSVKQTTC